jgi:cyclophilin family peptidyl-prolyl cis-trans isomerase
MKWNVIFWMGCLGMLLASSCARPVAQFAYKGAPEAQTPLAFDNRSEKATQYQWDFGDGTTSAEAAPEHTYDQAGTYTVVLKAINKRGKEAILTQEVYVDEPMTAQFSMTGKMVAPTTLQFKNQSEGAVRYEWDFGDGNTATGTSPSHRYRQSGNYEIQLRAINSRERSETYTQRVQIKPPVECLVEIETAFGNMVARLSNATPKHQENFLKLADAGYFDSLLFHRVIDGFMIQGGDPNSRNAKPGQSLGSGGPGYTIPAEFVDSLVHVKGALSAARLGDNVNPKKASSGSQFFIVHGRPVNKSALDKTAAQKGIRYTTSQQASYEKLGGTPFLDGDYTVFGQVIEGLDVIDKIAKVSKDRRDRPKENVYMKIRVIK